MHKINLSNELSSVSPEFSVKCAGNGWVIEFNGRNLDDEWSTLTILCEDVDIVANYIAEHSEMKHD